MAANISCLFAFVNIPSAKLNRSVKSMIKLILSGAWPETSNRIAVGTTSRTTVMMVRIRRTSISMRYLEYRCMCPSLDLASSSGPEKTFCMAARCSAKTSMGIKGKKRKKKNVRVRDSWEFWLSSLRQSHQTSRLLGRRLERRNPQGAE